MFFIGLPFLILAGLLPTSMFLYKFARVLSRLILFALGVRLNIQGEFPTDRPYIFMSNHASFIDVFVLGAVLEGKFTGVAAEEYFRNPLWGLIGWRMKLIPINRTDLGAAIRSIRIAEDRLRQGYSVGILPEGTRTLTNRLQPFKKGGFHMAMNTKTAIVPIGLEGTYTFKPKDTWLLNPGIITVRIGRPICYEQYQDRSIDDLMEEIRRQLLLLTGETGKSPDSPGS